MYFSYSHCTRKTEKNIKGGLLLLIYKASVGTVFANSTQIPNQIGTKKRKCAF